MTVKLDEYERENRLGIVAHNCQMQALNLEAFMSRYGDELNRSEITILSRIARELREHQKDIGIVERRNLS